MYIGAVVKEEFSGKKERKKERKKDTQISVVGYEWDIYSIQNKVQFINVIIKSHNIIIIYYSFTRQSNLFSKDKSRGESSFSSCKRVVPAVEKSPSAKREGIFQRPDHEFTTGK